MGAVDYACFNIFCRNGRFESRLTPSGVNSESLSAFRSSFSVIRKVGLCLPPIGPSSSSVTVKNIMSNDK